MNKRTFDDICEIAEGVLLAIVLIVLFWLYLFATPDQNSAEFDAAQEESRQAEMNGEWGGLNHD